MGDLWRVPGKRLEQSGEGETEKCKGEEQEEQAWGGRRSTNRFGRVVLIC